MNSYCVDNKTVKENSCIHVLFVIKTVSCLNFFLFYKTILLNKLSLPFTKDFFQNKNYCRYLFCENIGDCETNILRSFLKFSQEITLVSSHLYSCLTFSSLKKVQLHFSQCKPTKRIYSTFSATPRLLDRPVDIAVGVGGCTRCSPNEPASRPEAGRARLE